MKKLKDYLDDNVRTYKYRIKTVSELTDKMLDRIDAALTKYDCVYFGKPVVTIVEDYVKGMWEVHNRRIKDNEVVENV
jgi:hypothetical protein